MTTISASAPPETRTKRSRIWRSFSLFSAPPIGTIQPRLSPWGILLGIQQRLLERERFRVPPPRAHPVSIVHFTADNDCLRVACRGQHRTIGLSGALRFNGLWQGK